MLPFADNFLAGSLLSLLLPIGLLIAIAIWFGSHRHAPARRPGNDGRASADRVGGSARRSPRADRHWGRRLLIDAGAGIETGGLHRRRLARGLRSDCALRS